MRDIPGPDTHASPGADIDTTQALRGQRLVQIASYVMAMMLFTIPIYVWTGQLTAVYPLIGGVLLMGGCLWLNRAGHLVWANTIFLLSITATASALMWFNEGLQDSVVLAYPIILILASLLGGRRMFWSLLGFMLLFLCFVAVATDIYPLRVNHWASTPMDRLRDVLLIMAVCGYVVWLVVNDMHKALASLKNQIEMFKASQTRLTYLSQHDALTGLPNRTLGRDRIEQAIANARRQQHRVALLFVDLDNFKGINDSLGHDAGDAFLKEVATRLGHCVRKSDVLDRHGGDEFVIGLPDPGDAHAISAMATNVLTALKAPFLIKETEISCSCSIGIALFPNDGDDYESLLRQADIAMYQAKDSGRNAWRFFDPAMHANIQQNLLLVSGLRAALQHQELVLHYQPVVNLASGRVVGAEALLRWQHPQRGLVAPGEFIPAAESSGLIVEMGEWVLNEACRQMVAWQQAGCADFVLAVNLSPVQFRRGNIDALVAQALQQSGLRPACLELEITESTLLQDNEAFMLALQRVKALGVQISIDDFGTGYSNLSYLQRFAVNKLKIDQSFVRRLQNGPQDRAIVNAIIQMARSLDLSTTAEGIEDEGVRQLLLELGCEQGQGYLFARPVPPDQFAQLVRKQPG